MEKRFDRSKISYINNLNHDYSVQDNDAPQSREVTVPTQGNFSYVFHEAKSGNEMAAVQIDEWHRYCKASNNREKNVLNQIRKAVEEIFE